ncbi:MAG TPA: GNAT family N-acetyltransferase [Candidatus Binatus sp.]|nr:GNAT family N-acetyltransferase [Candidatus Binatus sp.]
MADPASGQAVFVIAARGTVVGTAIWAPSGDPDATPDTAEVRTIYLGPDAIGRGLGRHLLATVVSDVADHGLRVATLWVLESNARARRFYEAAGWRADGAIKTDERRDGSLHEVRYRRSLEWSTPPEVNPRGVELEERSRG